MQCTSNGDAFDAACHQLHTVVGAVGLKSAHAVATAVEQHRAPGSAKLQRLLVGQILEVGEFNKFTFISGRFDVHALSLELSTPSV